MRVKITLSYNGANFLGFQIQKETKQTVANQIQIALQKLDINTNIVASGRTDKGVHALNQIIHIDIEDFWDLHRLHIALNKILPDSIYIKHINIVDKDFHARYNAKKRSYLYIFTTNKPNPFVEDIVTFCNFEIDKDKIHKALKLFIGIHDFKNFMKQGGGTKSSVREIYKTKLIQLNKNTYACYFLGNGFLRSQIRMIMDFIFKISLEKLTLVQLQEQLSLDKKYSNTLAPANGLYLSKIYY